MVDLQGKVIAITGSSRGIGFCIAKTFAENGASLIMNARNENSNFKERCEEIRDLYGVTVIECPGNVGDPETAQNIAKEAFSNFRSLDVMVNNAGILQDALIGMIDADQIRQTISVNLEGVIFCSQAAARVMRRNKKGSIINLTSIIGTNGNTGQMVYGASKAGVIGATISSSKELCSDGIRVNAIAPGYIETDMIKNIPNDTHQQRLKSIGMGRIGSPQDIANIALFLASDLSTYITGQTIGVDGGMLI